MFHRNELFSHTKKMEAVAKTRNCWNVTNETTDFSDCFWV